MTEFKKFKPGETVEICFLPPKVEEDYSKYIHIHFNPILKPIPNSLISTKVLLDAYTNLREELNGKCSNDICPHIEIKFHTRKVKRTSITTRNHIYLFCSFCRKSWDVDFCPCKTNKPAYKIFLRLDEVINQLREKLSKEYSS